MSRAFFSLASIADSVNGGDVDAAMCDAASLVPMGLSVLKCLYVHLSEDATRGDLARSEIADIVAVAGGLIELSGAVEDFARDNRKGAL